MLEIILRLRQICDAAALCPVPPPDPAEETSPEGKATPELLARLAAVLEVSDEKLTAVQTCYGRQPVLHASTSSSLQLALETDMQPQQRSFLEVLSTTSLNRMMMSQRAYCRNFDHPGDCWMC